jgi:hypothetical protein
MQIPCEDVARVTQRRISVRPRCRTGCRPSRRDASTDFERQFYGGEAGRVALPDAQTIGMRRLRYLLRER